MEVPHHLIDAVRLEVETGAILAARQGFARERLLGEQREPGACGASVLIEQLERVTEAMLPPAESPPSVILAGVDAILFGVVEQPAHEELDLIDLGRELGLRRHLVFDGVREDARPLGDEPHRHLELVKGSIGEPTPVDVHQRTRSAKLDGFARGVTTHCQRAVWSGKHEGVATAPISGHGPSPSIV